MLSSTGIRLELPRARAQGLGEFLLVGGLTPLLFALSFALRRFLPFDDAELAFGFTFFYAAHLINDPHFAVSYLLFYEEARERAWGAAFSGAQRLRYWLAGFVVPLCLALWIGHALASSSRASMGVLVQLMFLLVGWHYVKQGFGVLLTLAARRGVTFHARERLALLAHALCGWAYAWASPYDAGHAAEEKGVLYTTFAQPRWLEPLTLAALLGSLVAVLYTLAPRRRELSLLFTPLTGFFCSIWAWSVFSSADPLVRYAIPALHSVQYLYFVYLLKGGEAREREQEPWFETAAPVRLLRLAGGALLLGWLLFHGLPTWLDSPTARGPLGATPWFAGLYAFVNVHHYFMDSVLWRRENPRTRYLRIAR